jgi:molecular chaperone GrpE
MKSDKRFIPISSGDAAHLRPETPGSLNDTRNPPEATAHAASGDPEVLQQQLAALKDDYLRLRAEFDNFIKRSQRNAEQQGAAEKEAFIRDLLPILDNLERALASEQPDSCVPLHRGVTITLEEVGRLLQRHGIVPVADMGLPFDPHRHEAVFVRQDPAQPDRIVLDVMQRGYCRGDKVFRPAQVVVNDLSRSHGVDDGR